LPDDRQESPGVKFLTDLRDAHSAVGPLRFWIVTGVTVAFITCFVAVESWLSTMLDWPDAFGFQCHGRRCLLTKIVNSGQLLHSNSAYAWGLFALYWAMPVFFACAVIVIRVKGRRRNTILPMK
jgi:hypothetical protein